MTLQVEGRYACHKVTCALRNYFFIIIFAAFCAVNSVFAIDDDPLQSVKDHVYTVLSNVKAPQSTGYTKGDYLDTIDGIVNFFRDYQQTDGTIYDPYTGNEVQYATPYYALCGSVLYISNYRSDDAGAAIYDEDFLESVSLALDRATYELFTSTCAGSHSNFFTVPSMIAYLNLRDHVDSTRRTLWETRLTQMPSSQYGTHTLNWNLTASCGEYLRYINGFTSDTTYMETYIENNMSQLTLEGLYRDGGYPYAPMAYDGFARLNFQLLLLNGYAYTTFPGAEDMAEYMRRGAFTSLLMQSPWGESPIGGRSAQHQWNDTEMCFIYEVWADKANDEGDAVLAAAFKRAAHLSYSSLLRWVRPNGSVWIVKNCVAPALRFGYERYSYLSQYNMWTAGFLSLAYMHANDSIAEGPAPADIGGFAFAVPDVHRGFANCGGLYLEVDMDPEDTYNTAGLVRLHKAGVEPLVCPSASTSDVGALDGTPELGHGIAWYNGTDWSSLAEMSNTQITSFDFTTNSMSSSLVDFTVTYNFTDVDGASSVVENYSVDPNQVFVTATVNGPKTFTKLRYAGFLYDGQRDYTVGYGDGIAQTAYGDNLMTMEFTSHPSTPFDRTFTAVNSRNGYLEAIEAVVKDQTVSYVLRPEIDTTGAKFIAENSFIGIESVDIPSYDISAATAGSEESGNPKENSYDNDESTRWCDDDTLSNAWIMYDLGTVRAIGQINILYYNGYRTYPIQIQVSTDGSTWTEVFNGDSGGDESDYWNTRFEAVSGRYVKIAMTDRNSDGSYWFSIYEIKIYGQEQTDTTAPAMPTGLSIISGDSTIFLNWDDNTESDFGGYNIKRSLTSGGPYTTIASDIKLSNYMDNSVTIGNAYYYVISAVDTSGNEGSNSGQASGAAIDITPPLAPTGLTASASNGTVTLDWDDNSDTDLASYNVYRSAVSKGSYRLVASGVLVSNYDDSTVINGIEYFYVVVAVDSVGWESDFSGEVSATSIIREQLTIVASTAGSEESGNEHEYSYDTDASTRWCNNGWLSSPLSCAWIQYDFGEVLYISQIQMLLYKGTSRTYPLLIEVSTNGANWTEVFSGETQVSSGYWQMSIETVSARYIRFTLTSTNSDGGSWFSIYEAQIWGKTSIDAISPEQPENLTAIAKDGSIVLNWDANSESDLAGYNVKRSTVSDNGCSTIAVATAVTNQFSDSDVYSGVKYYYVVSAVDTSANESDNSDQVSAPLYSGDLTIDNRVDMDDLSELSLDWLSDYSMGNLLEIAADWLE